MNIDSRLRLHDLGYYEVIEKPSVSELRKYYSEKYYQEAHSSYEHSYSNAELAYFQNKLIQKYYFVNKANPSLQEGSKFLDVGCGEGYALSFFKDKGFDVKGIDFSDAGVKSKNVACLPFIKTGDLFNLLNEEIDSNSKYDVILLQNVLEHVIDPIMLLKSLRSLISNNGIAIVTVPNDYSIIQREALQRGHICEHFWVIPPDHLSYFDYGSLNNIVDYSGWRCFDIIGDFPVDYYLFHEGSNYIADKLSGKAAHKARIEIENLISLQPIENVINFWRSTAMVGLGRDLTAYIIPD